MLKNRNLSSSIENQLLGYLTKKASFWVIGSMLVRCQAFRKIVSNWHLVDDKVDLHIFIVIFCSKLSVIASVSFAQCGN